MRKPNRRMALCGITGAGITALLSGSPSTVAGDASAAQKRELIVVGPFNVGEWFEKSKLKMDGLFNLGAPERKDIAKSLKECLAYVIDQRVWKDKKKVRFAEGKDAGPKLAFTGKLHHAWETKEKTFTIQVATSSVVADVTNYDASPPSRRVIVEVGLMTAGSTALGNTKSKCFFVPEAFFYDIMGRLK